MKKLFLFIAMAGLVWATATRSETTGNSGLTTDSASAEPVITSIRLEGTNVVVLALVPAGVTKVTLESCRRLGEEAWTPRAVARLEGEGGEVTFRLALSPDIEMLRVRADAREALPGFFYRGQSSFAAQPVSGSGFARGNVLDATGAANPFGGFVTFNNNASPSGIGSPTIQPRTVVESDIWKASGDTLYFFNQYRGLQVIDISQPDTPVVRGTVPISAAGEQMYLPDDAHVVLLARDGCNWGNDAESQALVAEIKDGKPEVAASLPIQGTIKESRLVGTALYVASDAYRKIVSTNTVGGEQWEWSTLLSSFDLSRPDQPAARSAEWVSGSGGVVTATDRFLFVAGVQSGDGRPVIRVFDISAPDGTVVGVSTVEPLGEVKDKFKLNLDGDVLTVVSEQWSGVRTTWVETFSLANPSAPQKLGSLNLIQGETLFATRFDRNRLYVVTFRQVDPLWIVDLSDPAQPKVAGELQVPGWSTYIHPLGDRLVTIGRDNTAGPRTTVSLFDVQDSAHPALLGRVALGEQYSYSEANFDEKAVGVLPDDGLILLPFSTWTTNGNFQGVQLVDLSRDSLALRGRIEHEMQARRATLHRDRIISVSGRELLSVDATDRDHPVLRFSAQLSWPVDQVFLSGQYLLEMDPGRGNAAGPHVWAALADHPDQLLNRLSLTNLPFLGATKQGDHLYVAQGQSAQITSQWSDTEQKWQTTTNPGVLSLTVLDLSQLPTLAVAGQTQTATLDNNLWGNWTALWPRPGLLVWKSSVGFSVLPGGPIFTLNPLPLVGMPGTVGGVLTAQPTIAWGAPSFVGGGIFPSPIWFAPNFGGSMRLIAFDVSDATAPRRVSDIDPARDKNWSGFSRAFAADGLVYLSHREFEIQTTDTNYSIVTNIVYDTVTNIVTVTNVVQVPQATTITNYEHVTNVAVLAVVNRSAETNSWQWPDSSALAGVLAGGGYHSLLLDPQGTAWAWGANWLGQLGNGTRSADREQIEAVQGLDGVKSLAAGYWHNLALKSDGTVWAWGADTFGQLGNGPPVYPPGLPPLPDMGSPTPIRALVLSNVVTVAAGGFHSLALKDDGSVWAWGANGYGQLDDGSTDDQHSPTMVAGLSDVRALAAGVFHSLAVQTGGTVWAWGQNDFGQLGNDTPTNSKQPAPVSGLADVVAVAGGFSHSLALKSDGTVWGWGRGDAGQLGDGAAAANSHPIPVAGLSSVVALAAGISHSLALKSDGTVWTWGGNDFGQLGDGTTNNRSAPAAIEDLSNAVAVAAGSRFSLALTSDGAVWAWGDNSHGQLGNGVPIAVTNEAIRTNVSSIITYLTVTNITQQTNYTSVPREVLLTNEWPVTTWFEHHYLDVVDYALPADPTVRPPVNIPGLLQGLSHGGGLLYTLAQRPAAEGGSDLSEWLDASAYDGVEAHLVDSLALPSQWPHPVLVYSAAVFIGRPAPDTNSAPQLETWAMADTGKFVKLGGAQLNLPAQNFAAFGDLLAAQNGNDVQLFDASNLSAPALIGSGSPGGCVGFNLENADGSADRGLWLPLGDYGVSRIGLMQHSSAP